MHKYSLVHKRLVQRSLGGIPPYRLWPLGNIDHDSKWDGLTSPYGSRYIIGQRLHEYFGGAVHEVSEQKGLKFGTS